MRLMRSLDKCTSPLLDNFEAASAALTAKFAPEPAPDPIPEPPRVSAPMHTAVPMVSAPVTREGPRHGYPSVPASGRAYRGRGSRWRSAAGIVAALSAFVIFCGYSPPLSSLVLTSGPAAHHRICSIASVAL